MIDIGTETETVIGNVAEEIEMVTGEVIAGMMIEMNIEVSVAITDLKGVGLNLQGSKMSL